MAHWAMVLLLSLVACGNPFVKDNCAKVFCGPGQFCLTAAEPDSAEGPFGDLPECADAPASCGPVVTCDCLDCIECDKSGGLVRCTR